MKHLLNTLTFSRIILGLLFLYVTCFLNANRFLILIIFVLVCLSDYFDGKIARKYGLSSSGGAILDVLCDFIFIVLSTLSLIIIDLIPFWFIFIIMLKMAEFFFTSKTDNLYFEKFGHLVALMFYALPSFSIIFNFSKDLILILTIFVTICAIISSMLRIRNTRGLN